MTGSNHSYGIDWLDENELYDITKRVFSKALGVTKRGKPTPPDPFTLLAYAIASEKELSDALNFEFERALNKTLSNAVGTWHQCVLGLAEGWQDLGPSGGKVDLRTCDGNVDERTGKPIYAEVKNRYNTIKASDEKELWDTLDTIARSNNAIAYVFQIVPEKPERYDRPWNVSGRSLRDHVRCCDGVTAYSMVFKRPNALAEIYEVLPDVFSDILDNKCSIERESMTNLFCASFPTG